MMLGSVFNRHQASSSELSTRLRIMKIGKDSYPFSEFRGLGSPGVDLGQPGDIYIDITPGLHALYGRYAESWVLWPGANDASNLLRHPLRSDRCLWCHITSVGWIHPGHVRVNSANPSELLSETLKSQVKASEESKKRKRQSLPQPIRTEQPSFSTNTPSPSLSRYSVENQSTTDVLPFLSSAMPYSQPAHDYMLSRTLSPTDISVIRNSDCSRSPTTAHQRSIPTETDSTSTADNLNELSVGIPQERCNSMKRIDLRKVAFGGTGNKIRPFAKSQRRRVSLPTHTSSISYPAYEEQSLPQLTQPSIHDSEVLKIFRNDGSPLGSAQVSSATTFREPFVNDTGPENFPVKPFSLDLSEITGGSFVTKILHNSASVASTNSGHPAEATQRSDINNELALDIAIAELRKVKDASDAIAVHLREANDKIDLLEAENAKLRAQLLSQRQSNSPPSDIPLMTTDVEIPPAVDSHGLFGVEELNYSRRESTGPREIVRHSPQLNPSREELESTFAQKHSETPSGSLLLADTSIVTETTSLDQALPPTETANVERRNTIDNLNVEADSPSIDGRNSFELNMNICSPMKDVISWQASPVTTSELPRMRDIHRSVLFAKAGTLSICRICLGTKLGGIETVDEAFRTSEDSLELMQEHYEKEHPIDCEAVLNMSDEDLVDVVSILSTEY